MVSGINYAFKLPTSYYFVDGLSGQEKAVLLDKEVQKLTIECKVKVVNVTFDGAKSNLTMCRELNADLEGYEPYMLNKYDSNSKIYFTPDACHMLKLARNVLGREREDKQGKTWKTVLFQDGEEIDWQYFGELVNIQQKMKMQFPGCKFTKQHWMYSSNKMCVKLAVQTFSNGVCNALGALKNLNPAFENVGATIQYCKHMGDVFDVLNSKDTGDSSKNGFKRPLCPETIENAKALFNKVVEYNKSIEFAERDSAGNTTERRKLINSTLKMAFLGFNCTMKNVMNMYDDLVATGKIDKLCTLRISQDQLETLFGSIRNMGGCNRNPTPIQFESAMRTLICQHEVKTPTLGNCEENEINILNVNSGKSKQREVAENEQESSESIFDDGAEEERLKCVEMLMPYYASKTEAKLVENNVFDCSLCNEVFGENACTKDHLLELWATFDENEWQPCTSTVDIVLSAERFTTKKLNSSEDYHAIVTEIFGSLVVDELYVESDFVHGYDDNSNHRTISHKQDSITKIIEMFLDIRFREMGRATTLRSIKKFYGGKFKQFAGQ